MKKTLLILSAAAAFLTAACSENKTADTAATTDGMETTTTTSTATATQTSYTPEAIERRADRMSMDMASSMKFDDATRDKVRTAYMTRGQRLGELETKYATDTMGRAAAMRDVYNTTDTEMKSILTDPTQYSAYESNRANYMDSRYMDDNSTMSSSSDMSTSTMANSSDMNSTSGTMESGASVSKMKAKADDGSKIKLKDNGKVKMKDADGEKTKM